MSSWKFKKCKLSLLCSVRQLQVLVPELFCAYGNKISLPLPLASLPKPEIATDFRKRHFTHDACRLVHTHREIRAQCGGCYLSWFGLQSPPLREWIRMLSMKRGLLKILKRHVCFTN